jgi:hypothetical protein
MSYTEVLFFNDNKCCYFKTCDVILYQYVLNNYKQQGKISNETLTNLVTDYIKLWLQYIDNNMVITNIALVDKIDNFNPASYHIIIDTTTQKLNNNEIYKKFLSDNNFFEDNDYDDDEIDYIEKKSKKKYPEFTLEKWPDYGEEDLQEKPDKHFDYDKWREEVRQAEIKEADRRKKMDEIFKKKYGEKYISREYLDSKLNCANLKGDFYWKILKIVSNKDKHKFFTNKSATQQYKLQRYSYNNYHKWPYRYIIINAIKREYRIDETYSFEEKELFFTNISNNHTFGVKNYSVIVDDGNDYYGSHAHDIKIEYMNINKKDIDTDMFLELITDNITL